jgi:uncharacterized protein YecT (DUF1311 family)
VLCASLAVLAAALWRVSIEYSGARAVPASTAATQPTVPTPSSAGAFNVGVDCAKASSPSEQLTCSDDELKLVEQEMAAAYARKLRQLSSAQQEALKQDHAAWHEDYARTCDAIGGGEMLKKCIFEHLSNRTHELDEAASR